MTTRTETTASRWERRALDARWLPWVALAVLCAVAFWEIMRAGRGLFFFGDEWAVLLHRRGLSPDTFLRPHNEHVIAIPIAVYKLLLQVFGMTSYRPYQVAVALVHLITCVLLYLYARPRLGPWIALVPTALLLFLGSAWEDILWPFQISFIGSVAFGLAMLLAFDARRDVLAALALLGSLFCSGLGLPVLVIAAVEIALDPQRRRRAWVVVVPALAIGVAVLAGHRNAVNDYATLSAALRWGLESAAAGFGAFGGVGIAWGRLLLLAGAVGLVMAARRRGGVPPRAIAVGAGLIAYWLASGLSRAGVSPPDVSRYLYASAALLLVLFVTMVPRPQLGRVGAWGLVAATAAFCVAGSGLLREGVLQRLAPGAVRPEALTALELARDTVAPDYRIDPAFSPDLDARSYLDAVRAFGSPAVPVDKLRTVPDTFRRTFDGALTAALGIALTPGTAPDGTVAPTVDAAAQGTVTGTGACRRFTPDGAAATLDLALPAGTYALETDDGPAANLYLRRLADTFGDNPSFVLPPSTPSLLSLPAARLDDPWRLRVGTQQPVRVCSVR